jgi:hypothetical protein
MRVKEGLASQRELAITEHDREEDEDPDQT